MEKKKEDYILDLDAMTSQEKVTTNITTANNSNELLDEYNNCILCGTELLFVHVTDFGDEVVFEESSCPNCNIKSKKKAHRLQ